jgi:hypothetical protein
MNVERREWSRQGQGLRVIITEQSLDATGERAVDTLDGRLTGAS